MTRPASITPPVTLTRPANSALRVLRLAGALAVTVSGTAAADPARELRVCADPDNLPFSNDQLEGFENKIAQVIAADLNASVRYTWHSQRRGFIRQTLKAGECDLVIGVPSGYEPVLSTKPYYTSSYVFVYARNKHLNLRSFDDPVLRKIRIGLHAFGEDGANSPPAHALGRRGIARNVVGYTILDTADSPIGKIIDAVAAGEIDVAIVWGPFAGYFAKRQPIELEVAPVSSNTEEAFLPLIYDISMGVRRGDTAFKEQLEGILDRRRGEIRKILEAYGVPINLSRPIWAASPAIRKILEAYGVPIARAAH
jgi:mxaJ protein